MFGILILAAFVIGSEWLVSRGVMPAYLIKARTGQTLWRALLSILVTVALVGWLHLPAVIAIVVTIYFATIIANRYLQVFEAMERGKRG